MSDYQGPQSGWGAPGAPSQPSQPGQIPPPPPPGGPWAPGPVPPVPPVGPGGVPPTQWMSGPGGSYVAPKPKGGKGKIVGAAIAAVAVLGAGAFAAVQLTGGSGSSGGSDSPEAAVQSMFDALEQNDIVGMLDHLAPGEREVIKDQVTDLVNEGKRLGLLSDDTTLDNVPGFTVDFEGLEYDIEERNDRVSMVTLTAGSVTASGSFSDLPMGDVILDQVGDEIPPDAPEETFDIADVVDEGGSLPQVGVVEQDGKWYVSAFYTSAELAAVAGGYTMPDEPIAAVGAASPEDAVTEMVEAAFSADVERVIELTPPDEMAALHDYGQILVDMAAEQVPPGESVLGSDFELTIDGYEFETTDVTGGTKVLPTHVAFTVTGTNDSEGDGGTVEVTKVDDTCVEYSIVGTEDGEPLDQSGRYCADDVRPPLEEEGTPSEVIDIAVRMTGQLGQLGVVTVEVDGEWYVSPSRTLYDPLIVAARGLERGDIDILVDYFTNG